ncbi:glycine zipper 2TM domain-containing protein [Rhodanobacter sp. UC4451_H18]
MTARIAKLALAASMTTGLALAGCATQPYGNSNNGYYGGQSSAYGNQPVRCNTCGVVQEVQQVYLENSGNGGTLGAIIGAVAGGVVGNQVGKRSGADKVAWRIVVRLDDGRYATVTQRENPGLRQGDYVEVRGDHVYPR